jgi:predicted transposase/invertase (TIGR01784 family)
MIHLRHGEEPIGIAVATAPRPRGEGTSYKWERFGVRVAYDYINVDVTKLEDQALLANESRMGLLLYALKCAHLSGDDEEEKFRYLRVISNLWAERRWDSDEKRIMRLAVDYVVNLKDPRCVKEMLEHMKTLVMEEADREMYVSMFERGYTAIGEEKGLEKGLAKGRMEGRMEERWNVAMSMLRDGLPVEKIIQYTNLPREEVGKLASVGASAYPGHV